MHNLCRYKLTNSIRIKTTIKLVMLSVITFTFLAIDGFTISEPEPHTDIIPESK